MSNFSLGLKGKLIGKALINESLLICIRCCQKNVKGNVFNIVDEKKWGSTSSHLTAKLIPPPPPTMYLHNGANLFLNLCQRLSQKKPGQIAVVIHYSNLSSFFLTQTLLVLRRGNVSNFSCHSHSALYNVYPIALDRTKR